MKECFGKMLMAGRIQYISIRRAQKITSPPFASTSQLPNFLHSNISAILDQMCYFYVSAMNGMTPKQYFSDVAPCAL